MFFVLSFEKYESAEDRDVSVGFENKLQTNFWWSNIFSVYNAV